jgi:MSHA biogenesis protein MshO
MSAPLRRPRQRGFTLLEAVVVMVITAVIATALTAFLKVPVRAYTDALARSAATEMADNAMRRLTRDLRLALPNSVRVNAAKTHIEFIETKAGLRYLAEDDVNTPAGGSFLSWNNAAALTFTVVGGIPTGRQAPVGGVDSVVVYNLGESQAPADAYACGGINGCNRALIASVDTAASTITLVSNPFAAQATAGLALMSPSKRFHLVTTPVTYGCDSATRRLTRYWNYGYGLVQAAPPSGGSSAILAEKLADTPTSCVFTYTAMGNQHSALIGIALSFEVQDTNKSIITLYHQIHVNNTP